MMRLTIASAEHAAGAVTRALASRVGERGLCGLDHEVQRDAETAAILAITAGIGPEFMALEQQRKARFGNLDAAELQPADRVLLAD